MMGGCAIREASGNVTEYTAAVNETFHALYPEVPFYNDCVDRECGYGMLESAQVH